MQLDVDLDTMRKATGREPVQLAIDGSSFVPVLADLAGDDRITGTILVDYQDHVVGDFHRIDGSVANLTEWHRLQERGSVPDFATIEAWLEDRVHRHLRSFADGSSPFHSLALRIIDADATPQYLVTLPDRERRADYTKVRMPQFYYSRVRRNAGMRDTSDTLGQMIPDSELADRIGALSPVELPDFGANSKAIGEMVRRIERRGGKVVFIMFPRSGLVREADQRMFPRKMYWDRFLDIVRAPGLNYSDVPELAAFTCPDGAHLDMRDQEAFTRDLMQALDGLGQNPSVSSDIANLEPVR